MSVVEKAAAIDGAKMMAEAKFFSGYSRWMDDQSRYERWDESVKRVMDMHREQYADKMTDDLASLINEAEQAYNDKVALGAQRALQFGGDQLKKNNIRMYNCSSSYCDRPAFFNEAMENLLAGVGVGFSVQKHHVDKLPTIARRSTKKAKIYTIPDSIEGWSDAFAVLLSSYFTEGAVFPEYKGCQVHFDFSKIRPKGSKISGGFKAPGPDGLRAALIKCEDLLEESLKDEVSAKIRPIVAYDFVMHLSDAVLSGGVRRSATICLFDKDDQEMLNAKVGNWRQTNPQRARSNNSAIIKRDELTREEWAHIMQSVKSDGEPGFLFVDNKDITVNPCVEVGMYPVAPNGKSGWQFCNLVEINGAYCTTKERFMKACKVAAIICTLQAGYTNFPYLSPESRIITEREALIGVSITGWMNNPDVLFDTQNMIDGAETVKYWNKVVASMIGINPAARTTNVKPAGNTSILLGTAAGIHGDHSPRYIRNVQFNETDDVLQVIADHNPKMVEKSVWSANGTDHVVSFPVTAPANSIFKDSLYGVAQLEYVKKAQQYWVEYGTNHELCTIPEVRHNVSNTISVLDWDEVEQYIFDNRQWFAGVSLLGAYGDKDYAQAPFTEVLTTDEIMTEYGSGALFASGLIVDGLHAFNGDLWLACATVLGTGLKLTDDSSETLLKRDWVRRAKQFAANYFESELKMTYCLKDCHNLHKWDKINRTAVEIDFATKLTSQTFVDADTMASAGCVGGGCII